MGLAEGGHGVLGRESGRTAVGNNGNTLLAGNVLYSNLGRAARGEKGVNEDE
jgi:hypothetical protein